MILFLRMSVLGFVLAFGSKMEFGQCIDGKRMALRNGDKDAARSWHIVGIIMVLLNRVGFGLILAGPLGALLWMLLEVTVWPL